MTLDMNAIVTALLTFVGSVIGSLILWNKSRSDERQGVRNDVFKFNDTLTKQIEALQKRVEALEEENAKHTRTVVALETQIERIRAALYTVLDADLDDVLEQYHARIRRGKKDDANSDEHGPNHDRHKGSKTD